MIVVTRRVAKLSTKQEQTIENADEITNIEKECVSTNWILIFKLIKSSFS